MKQSERGERYQIRKKKRKEDMMLNMVIGVIIIIICILAYRLISSQSKDSTTTKHTTHHTTKKKKDDTTSILDKKEDQSDSMKEKDDSVEEAKDSANEKVIVPTKKKDVKEAYTNPSWKAIGTSQSEPHETQYVMKSQDWAEMIQAIAYATELTESDFVILFLGNDGAPNKAVGTIRTTDRKYKYRVHIEWVENQGWKPTLIEQINYN